MVEPYISGLCSVTIDCGLHVVTRRIRDKYETELKEVERSERATLEKFNTMKVMFVT